MSNTVNKYIEQYTQAKIEQFMQSDLKDTKRKKLIFLTKAISVSEFFMKELIKMQTKQKKRKRTAQYIFMYLGQMYTPEAIRIEERNIGLYKKMYKEIKNKK